jgi:DNA recombination protein RmuC
MDSLNEILLLIVGIIGFALGGLIIYLIIGRKASQNSDNPAKQEFEKEQVRLQTELAHADKLIEEKNRLIISKEREVGEKTGNLNEALKNLSVANERVQNFGESNKKLTEKIEQQANELKILHDAHSKVSANATAVENNLAEQRTQNNIKEVQIHELTELNNRLNSENATLLANLNANEGKLATQKTEIEDIRERSHREFENIANRILDTKTQKFTDTNRVNIENILLPLSKEINSFKTKVEETYEKESQQRFSLEKEVKALIEQTDKVSAEANNLATALKGQAKKQGDWGEMILERILETNGLVRGREYDVQHPIKNEDGDQQYLDVIVHLPDNRKLIIDSKVTLVAYDRYCSSETDEDRARCMKDHLQALSTHIDQLSGKKYDEMDSSPDFVMLFIPIEPAYLIAVQNDSELWSRAYSKRILLISPTNLMAAVKMVSDLWKRDQQSKNAYEIARQGEKLYDKFIGFLSSMDDIGSHIIKTQDAFNRALGQLKQGRGNLIRQAEKLKQLGIKSPKNIPATMMNYDAEFSAEKESETVIDKPIVNVLGSFGT